MGVALLAVGALVVPASSSATATSSTPNDARAQREQVRSQKAAVAADVDALKADDAEISAALETINANVRGQQSAYDDAKQQADAAEQQAADAAAAVLAKEAEIVELRDAIAEFGVRAYVNPPTEDLLDGFREDSASEATLKKSLIDIRSGQDADVLDRLKSAESELEAARADADDAQRVAETRLEGVTAQLSELQAAQSQQQAFADQVEARLNERLAESASLAATDSALSAEIAKQEEAIAAQLRAVQRPPSSGGGPISIPTAPGLVTIGGITVAESIASNLQNLLAAASADGITLTGSGYRSIDSQIALRRQNCGSSDYAIYQMSASACSPATAIPGRSNHERGLAIDFKFANGSAAHNWMKANAGRWGWLPLAGEHWHWSVGGG